MAPEPTPELADAAARVLQGKGNHWRIHRDGLDVSLDGDFNLEDLEALTLLMRFQQAKVKKNAT